jgi:HlyD family secretion protein
VILDFVEPLDRVHTVGDAYRVEATIVVYRQEDALKAPVGALFRDGEGWAAFVVEDRRARKRAVKVPRRNGAEALVEAGLRAGEQVVVYPPDTLADGARVTLPGEPR